MLSCRESRVVHTVERGLNPLSTTSASGYIPERFENGVKAGYYRADKQ